MKKNTIKLTRKIQVNVDLPKGEERQAVIKKLYQYQNCLSTGSQYDCIASLCAGNALGLLLPDR